MTLQDWQNKNLGGRIDYDKAYGYQCVDAIRDYVDNVWGFKSSAFYHDGALKDGGARDAFLDYPRSLVNGNTKVQRIENNHSDVNQVPQKGDVLVFGGTKTNEYGHIVIVVDAQPGKPTFSAIEQNGARVSGSGLGDDAIRLREFKWVNVLGWLHFDNQPQPEPTNPVPSQPEPAQPPQVNYDEYTVKPNQGLGDVFVDKYKKPVKWGSDEWNSFKNIVSQMNPGLNVNSLPKGAVIKLPKSL